MTDYTLIIGHRDRGVDWHRQANLDSALEWWLDHGVDPIVVDDGQTGDAQWNRSAAYNYGATQTNTDILVYTEADMLLSLEQIAAGVELAAEQPGLVVPFSKFMAMTEADSDDVRKRLLHPSDAKADQVRGDRQSIGAVNIVSRQSLEVVGGYDEQFSGHAYDDDAMEWAFSICCGPTRFVDGPAWHQWHMPGAFYATPESTIADREATERNRQRWELYRAARTPDDIRALTMGAQSNGIEIAEAEVID